MQADSSPHRAYAMHVIITQALRKQSSAGGEVLVRQT